MGIGMSVLIAIGVLTEIVRRFRGLPLSAADLVTPPVVLIGMGLWSLRGAALTGTDLGWLLAGSAVGLALGAARGATPVLFIRGGVLWQRYRPSTLLVWAAAILINGGLGFAATAAGMHGDARPITLSLGVGMLGEMLTLGVRGLATGLPFAPPRKTGPSAGVERRAEAARAARPVTEGRLDQSPTVRDGMAWLRGRAAGGAR